MHRRFIILLSFILFLGVRTSAQSADAEIEQALDGPQQAQEIIPEAPPKEKQAAERKKICNCKFDSSVAYRDRRERIGGFVAVQAGLYAPVYYQPNFAAQSNFNSYYGSSGVSVDLALAIKLNFFLGSIGPYASAGFYSVAHNTADPHSTGKLTVTPLTIGGIYTLDNLFSEPYVAPYAILGAYTDIYSETAGGLSVSGNTPTAMFYAAGLNFQLDWIDSDTHDSGYEDFGIENTFLYVEARSYLIATNTVPNLSTPLQFFGGLKVEF